MREELLKFERYQKQFRFLHENDITTKSELIAEKIKLKEDMGGLVSARRRLIHAKKGG